MKISVVGLNHATAPVEVRERLAFKSDHLPEVLARIRQLPGVLETVILSTCNRVEIAAATDDFDNPVDALSDMLAQSRQVDAGWIRQFLYYYEDREAIRHLFRVAASLDSMVVGEPQILGQMKESYEVAKAQGTLNGLLDSVLTRAFSVAKRVRTETDIGQSAVSVSYAAVELARQIFGSLRGSKVMLIGAGKMSELAARHLERAGVAGILVTNRSPERAQAMADLFRGWIVDYGHFVSALTGVDVVIASSGAPHYILRRDELKRVISARRNRPIFLIDIAVPRNVEPSANELEGVFLYDIDDLQRVVEENRRGRESEAVQAEQIVTEEVDRMMSRLKARELTPVIVGLQQQLESIRTAELERVRTKLAGLTPQQQEVVEALTKGMMNKIAHGPIAELRRSAEHPAGHHFVDFIRRVFRIE
jgi:glutamyl-tRNA reductase